MTRLLELDAYVTGELADGAAADAFEEALFDAPDDPDLAFVDRLARQGAKLAEHGTFEMGVPRAHLDVLRARGHTVEVVHLGAPGNRETRTLQFGRTSEFVATILPLGRTDLERVDVELHLATYNVTKTIRDVIVDTDGNIYGLCERPLFELSIGAGRTIARARRRDGAREVLGEWDLLGQLAPAP